MDQKSRGEKKISGNNDNVPLAFLMSQMISDVRLFQEALSDLINTLTDPDLAKQRVIVNQKLTLMLKPTRSVITNYDLSEYDQHSIINATSQVIALVKTYNATWDELMSIQSRYKTGSGYRHRKSDSSSRDSVVDSAVADALAAGLNENDEFDLSSTGCDFEI